jgi:hypothetical protein
MNKSRPFLSLKAPNLLIPAPTIAAPRAKGFDFRIVGLLG